MSCQKALTTRRGVLRYDSRSVEPELIEQVLIAAVAAPSPANLQPWAFVVVTEPELTRRTARYLLDVQDRGVFQAFLGLRPEETGRYIGLYDLFENAPCFIVVCNEPKAHFALPEHEGVLRDWYLMCLGAATANMMAAATALGLGTRWFGGFALDGGGVYLKESLGIPAAVEIAAVTPLGYPADDTPVRPRRSMERAELAAFGRGDQPALASLLRGKLPLDEVVHHNVW
jgi:5,6-dimethylbenzimidazole synthase